MIIKLIYIIFFRYSPCSPVWGNTPNAFLRNIQRVSIIRQNSPKDFAFIIRECCSSSTILFLSPKNFLLSAINGPNIDRSNGCSSSVIPVGIKWSLIYSPYAFYWHYLSYALCIYLKSSEFHHHHKILSNMF